MSHPPTTPRRDGRSGPPARRRPGTATAAGALGIAYGLVVLCAGVSGMLWGLSSFGEVGWLVFLCAFVIPLGVALMRNGAKLLSGEPEAGPRLSQLLMVPAGLSGVAIGSMVAQADLATSAAQNQLVGFNTAFVLSAGAIVLTEARSTKAYLGSF
ncbi:hypothetical protein [Streptomyces subrutilus]|uniref:Uncharacterized protein n=1 Tax=Streptomyces subrutilus TaxID=36818 RepID=A0A1E5PLC0_9ACTN|nr:hypothetical protein [Streptomyces subrutilus]OEJ30368.1 hypothetical protein BGK67_02475 [Streptomyces subrutilus]